MALILKQQGSYPLGQFDGYDTQVLSLKGGEVMTFYAIPVTNTDKAAKDVFDGYTDLSSVQSRTVAGLLSATATSGIAVRAACPVFLADEGIAGYGTIFGTVVGTMVGQTSYAAGAAGYTAASSAGNLIGPSTAAGSGKVTLWDKPGVYGVTLDACDSVASTGLAPTNTTLTTGTALTFVTTAATGNSLGQLTPISASNPACGSTITIPTVGFFIEFESNSSLVTTPNTLVAGYASPSGLPGGSNVGARSFYSAIFSFRP